ncbi:hypothetical protein RIF29_20534 [Crotalaria pallida]|uniref:Uncharacterized protein n=1 Tax=Crotalaria pallida TaxID=3830 RepID=A0AAN9F5S4_CROPI
MFYYHPTLNLEYPYPAPASTAALSLSPLLVLAVLLMPHGNSLLHALIALFASLLTAHRREVSNLAIVAAGQAVDATDPRSLRRSSSSL